MNVFDFTPNAPSADSAEPAALTGIRYPIAEIAQAEAALNAMRPIEKYKQLSDANWPPGPAFYPAVLWKVHSRPGSLAQANFGDILPSHTTRNTSGRGWISGVKPNSSAIDSFT